MIKTIRFIFAEWVFNRLLKPFERVVISQKVLATHGKSPEVRKEYEKAFGVNQKSRTAKQWNNLVRVYGIETVATVEGMTESAVKTKCKSFSEQIKEEYKLKRV